METINNIASAAAKAVWGDSETNKEPISGAQGDVSKGQPYDAGNLGPSEQEKVQENQDTRRTAEPGATSTAATTSTTTNTTNTDAHTGTGAGSSSNTNTPDIPTTKVGTADSVSQPSVEDASGAKPNLNDTSAAQNDTRAPEDDNAQVDLKGPGPRPLNIVAKEHGGDAGRDHDVDSKTSGVSSSSSDSKNSGDVAGDAESRGSGTQYVKTSGLAADGGDFDATKPGAGKEADRLMDEKGIHHEEGKDSGHGSHRGHTKDKPSLGERIKAKLHKH